ncbi:MAG: hypothetical protein M3Y51_01975 [Actinomycetota bacterium]|nr:hypothetical protein [Actinomycetota bacterium]
MSDRLVGWVFVAVTACIAVAMIARAAFGHSGGWWEWPIVIALCSLMLLIGLALLIPEPPGWLVPLVVGGYGVAMLAFGLFAVVDPTAVLVTAGRGPRTPTGARIMGTLLVVVGSVMSIGAALLRSRRED